MTHRFCRRAKFFFLTIASVFHFALPTIATGHSPTNLKLVNQSQADFEEDLFELRGCASSRHELALIRPGTIDWFIYSDRASLPSPCTVQFGLPNDQFLAGQPLQLLDNCRDEIVVYRPSQDGTNLGQCFVLENETAVKFQARRIHFSQTFGLNEDFATIGDFTGDGCDNFAVSQGGLFFIVDVDRNLVYDPAVDWVQSWPILIGPNDRLIAGEFGGIPGFEDVAVWRGDNSPSQGIWEFYFNGPNGLSQIANGTIQFGLAGDLPAAGIYRQNGFSDLVVFRPSAGRVFVNLFESAVGYGPSGDVDFDPSVPGTVGWNIAAVAVNIE